MHVRPSTLYGNFEVPPYDKSKNREVGFMEMQSMHIASHINYNICFRSAYVGWMFHLLVRIVLFYVKWVGGGCASSGMKGWCLLLILLSQSWLHKYPLLVSSCYRKCLDERLSPNHELMMQAVLGDVANLRRIQITIFIFIQSSPYGCLVSLLIAKQSWKQHDQIVFVCLLISLITLFLL